MASGNPSHNPASFHPTSLRKAINEEHVLLKRGIVVGDLLGEGSYACVYSGFLEKERIKCAIKVINKRKAPKDFLQRFLPRELEILKTIKHPNVIRCHEIVDVGPKVYITMELAGHGDLLEYIKLRGALAEGKARDFFGQVVSGMTYLHNKNIVHRDLKCENLLLDGSNKIKITDFGFSRKILKSDLSKTFCGSAAYAAPEILQGKPYQAFLYDIWSMGIILYIMVCGSMPYDDSNVKRMVRDQTEKKLGFSRSKQLTLDCKDLILKMLTPDPTRRATMHYIHHHLWMTGHDEIKQRPADEAGAKLDSEPVESPPEGRPIVDEEHPSVGFNKVSLSEMEIPGFSKYPRENHDDTEKQPKPHPQKNVRRPYSPNFVPI
ncbi:testis-specific serine/threonine-protein kinase 3-like [Asterias amurensis]|uniref:testis-specific serine/threonine-protein kinase 3-like n=1 Tax=Asterias amurensis TaxID=7602 RepID=UPI003AB62EE5